MYNPHLNSCRRLHAQSIYPSATCSSRSRRTRPCPFRTFEPLTVSRQGDQVPICWTQSMTAKSVRIGTGSLRAVPAHSALISSGAYRWRTLLKLWRSSFEPVWVLTFLLNGSVRIQMTCCARLLNGPTRMAFPTGRRLKRRPRLGRNGEMKKRDGQAGCSPSTRPGTKWAKTIPHPKPPNRNPEIQNHREATLFALTIRAALSIQELPALLAAAGKRVQ